MIMTGICKKMFLKRKIFEIFYGLQYFYEYAFFLWEKYPPQSIFGTEKTSF